MLSDPRAGGLRRHASGPLDQGAVGQTLLPAHAYTDPSWFADEQRSIFGDGWVWAGYEHWVGDVGDVYPITVAGEPLVLVRGTQGVHVFYNVCRHRGFLLCDTPHSMARVRCPYHGWTYGLDGGLQATPYWDGSPHSGPDDATRDTLHLIVAQSAIWAGMVFVHLGDAGRPFAEVLAPLSQAWAGLDLSRLAHAETRRYEVNANWKLVVENFLDFYHLPFVHPQVGSAGAALDVEDVVLDEQIIGGTYPRGATGKAAKSDRPLPTFGDMPQELRDRQDIFCVFPNALLFMEADWFQVIGFEPVAPDRTIEHMAVFVDRDAVGNDFAAARESLSTALFGVNDQDVPVLERLQAGRRSSTAGRGNLVTHWDQIGARFQLLVCQALQVPLASHHDEND